MTRFTRPITFLEIEWARTQKAQCLLCWGGGGNPVRFASKKRRLFAKNVIGLGRQPDA